LEHGQKMVIGRNTPWRITCRQWCRFCPCSMLRCNIKKVQNLWKRSPLSAEYNEAELLCTTGWRRV